MTKRTKSAEGIWKTAASHYIARFRDPAGIEKSKTFDTFEAARRYRDGMATSKDRGTYLDPQRGQVRVDAFYESWVARAKKSGKPTERTLIAYDEVWRHYVSPPLGSHRLSSVTRDDCQRAVDAASSPWRARDVRKVLSSFFSFAIKDERLTRNPASALDVPELEQGEPRVATMGEIESIASAIEPRYAALVLLSAYSALRWSELVGLTVADVDFLRRRVRVERAVVEYGARLITGKPKTKGSERWVSIPESVALVLSEHVRLFGGDGPLFHGNDGGTLRRSAFRHAWAKATAAAGMDGFRVRNLRHSGATWALEAGVSPVLVAFRLGHKTTRMIETHYARLIESMDAEIASRLEAARPAADFLRTFPGSESGSTGGNRRRRTP